MLTTNVRKSIVSALQLDLIGPQVGHDSKYLEETLTESPMFYYLTGFLVPHGSKVKVDVEEDETSVNSGDVDDDSSGGEEEAKVHIRRYGSSIGLSFLVSKATNSLKVNCRWGEYVAFKKNKDDKKELWKRINKEKTVTLPAILGTKSVSVENGIELMITVRPLNLSTNYNGLLPEGTKSVSCFFVNKKAMPAGVDPVESFLFQAEMEIEDQNGFIPRPNLRALESKDPDDCIADLQFANVHEYATGHGVAAHFFVESNKCNKIKTTWIPSYEVDPVTVPDIEGLRLEMRFYAEVASVADLKLALNPIVARYKLWIKNQEGLIPKGFKKREETGQYLLGKYNHALSRIETGIALLDDPKVFEAFKIANDAMSTAAEKRRPGEPAKWRPFQLAFILMSINGIVKPNEHDRDIVDLIYFPTGGGKTEAYLGVAAFTLIFRRLSDPSMNSAGVSILMRYTLRLLTLDQLERATTLICALELKRIDRPNELGQWPFEIGLWVGQGATPNRLGFIGDKDQYSARTVLKAYQDDRTNKSPVPLEKCPWCNEKLHKLNSFKLYPEPNRPTDLHVICNSRDCDFSPKGRAKKLPIVTVDDVIYKRLPCFVISTVDKFASMPWEDKIGKLFGRVDKYNDTGFYTAEENVAATNKLVNGVKPIDLIIQDELHLISGPLGTMVGLYETAVDELASRVISGKKVKPKVIASTATVRHAQKQVTALFARRNVDIFPVPGITANDSFFAKTQQASTDNPGRLYIGIAAQGCSTKNLLMKSYLSCMSAAQKQYELTGSKELVDPYMTALGYFNSLRELGGARRIVEDQINAKLRNYSSRKRADEEVSSILANREIKFEVLELTSRESTDKVAAAKHRLAVPFDDKDFVNVAIATNMISVGLDITRLGLMFVFGQPKTTSEYIQASSRVGRGKTPGLVVTLYNIHRHRDRSLYEKFVSYHQSYYRDVETTSVTPFSTKALDKGLAGTYLSMVRHLVSGMKTNDNAGAIIQKKNEIKEIVSKLIVERFKAATPDSTEMTEAALVKRLNVLLDDWEKIYKYCDDNNAEFNYVGKKTSLIHQYLDTDLIELPQDYLKFRANRSMREVEPSVNIWVRGLNDQDLED